MTPSVPILDGEHATWAALLDIPVAMLRKCMAGVGLESADVRRVLARGRGP